MARQGDLFERPARAPPRRLAHFIDVGDGIALYECRCGWRSDWEPYERPSDVRRGIPCVPCNELDRR